MQPASFACVCAIANSRAGGWNKQGGAVRGVWHLTLGAFVRSSHARGDAGSKTSAPESSWRETGSQLIRAVTQPGMESSDAARAAGSGGNVRGRDFGGAGEDWNPLLGSNSGPIML
jgi:hypothetical protein